MLTLLYYHRSILQINATVHITANLYKNCDKIKTKQRQSCEKKTTKHDKKPTKTKQGYNV